MVIPATVAVVATIVLAFWVSRRAENELKLRSPGTDHPPGADAAAVLNPVMGGKVIKGEGEAAALPGSWPEFRGPGRAGFLTQASGLARSWGATGPRELWSVAAGEGYGGVAVEAGRVYLMDYDQARRFSVLRCLSLADGREIWRYEYPLSVKRNHGMTRTVPTVAGRYVVAMDPKCNVACVDRESGELVWGLNLVREYGASVPPWYTGQCPLVDGESVILAPGGNTALLVAVDLATGKPRWKTPNPRDWKMTHSSVMTAEFAGQRMYVYCGSGGVAGVSATDGKLLWETTEWKISIAMVPTPVALPGGRLFLSGGYNAGSLMLQLTERDGALVPTTLFRLPPEVFGATQHSPVWLDGLIYGIRANGHFVCLDPTGKVKWSSGPAAQFGLGPFLIADGLIYAMNDNGALSLMELSKDKYLPLGKAQVLKGRESWGPMALAGSRLIVRDLTRVVCLEVAAK
jgi:outer membrane protein assembly factor BamB